MAKTINDPIYTDQKNVNLATNFNEPPKAVDGGEYDYVLSFFKRSMTDPVAAANFTESIYQVSRQADVPVLELVNSMEGQTGLQMNVSMAYFMNGIRSNSTMLGVTNTVRPNFYAGRSVLI